MADERSVTVRMRAEFGSYLTGLRTAAAETRGLAAASVQSQAKQQNGLASLGHGALLAGAAIGAGVGLAISKFAAFDQQMSHVQAATHETARNMGLLRDAAIEAGARTVFSASEAAAAEENLAKAGIATADILGGGLSGSLDLAAAGTLEVADAAEIAATTLTQFHLHGKDVSHIADLLAAAAGKAQGEVTDLAGALKFVGPVAAGMNVSLEETVGTLALFAKNGIIGEQAGTGLRGMLSALTSPSKQAAGVMKDLGIQVFDAQGNFIGLAGVAGQLQDALKDQTEAERSAALGRIFGNEQLTVARVLYDQGAASVDKWTKKVNDDGFAAETAAIKLDNLKGDIEQLSGSLETAFIKAGSGSNTMLRGLAQSTTGTVNAFSGLPGPVQGGALALAALSAAGLLAVGAFGTLVPRLAAGRLALRELGPAGIQADRGLSVLSRVGRYAVGILAITAAVDGLANSMAHDETGLNQTAKALLDFNRVGDRKSLRKLGLDLDELDGAIRRVTDTSTTEKLTKDLPNAIFGLGHTSLDLQDARNAVNSYDKALAQLAQSGHAKEAAEVFQRLQVHGEAFGLDASHFKKAFDDYAEALAGIDVAGGGAAQSTGDLTAGLESTDRATRNLLAPTKAVKEQIAALADELSDFIDPMGVYSQVLDDKKTKEQEAAQSTADATKRASDSWQDYAKKVHVSIDDYLDELERQIHAEEDWETNLLKLAARGVKPAVLAELRGMGKEAAPLIADLVNAPRKELARLSRDVLATSDRSQKQIAALLINAQPVLAKVAEVSGEKTAQAYAEKLAAGTITVQRIAERYGLAVRHAVPKDVDTHVHVKGLPEGAAAVAKLNRILDGIDGRVVTTYMRFQARFGGKNLGDGMPPINVQSSPDANFGGYADPAPRRTHYASGVRGAPGGWSWVGEQAPELMYVPKGANVYSAAESRQMVSARSIPAGRAGATHISESRSHHENYGDILVQGTTWADIQQELEDRRRVTSAPDYQGIG